MKTTIVTVLAMAALIGCRTQTQTAASEKKAEAATFPVTKPETDEERWARERITLDKKEAAGAIANYNVKDAPAGLPTATGSRQRVLNTIEELKGKLQGTILRVDGPALFRNGVDEWPEGALASDPDLGFL